MFNTGQIRVAQKLGWGQQSTNNRPYDPSYRSENTNKNTDYTTQQQKDIQELSKLLEEAINYSDSSRMKNRTGTEVRPEILAIAKSFETYASRFKNNNNTSEQNMKNELLAAAASLKKVVGKSDVQVLTFQLIVFRDKTWNEIAELFNVLKKKFNLKNLRDAQIKNSDIFKEAFREVNRQKVEQYQKEAEQAVAQNTPPPPPPEAATPNEVENITGISPIGADFNEVDKQVGNLVPEILKIDSTIDNLNEEVQKAYESALQQQADVGSSGSGKLPKVEDEDYRENNQDKEINKDIEEDPVLANTISKETESENEELPGTFNVHDTEFFEDLDKNKVHEAIWLNKNDIAAVAEQFMLYGSGYINDAREFLKSLRGYLEKSANVMSTADHLINDFSKSGRFKSFVSPTSTKGMLGRDKPSLPDNFDQLPPNKQDEKLRQASSYAHAYVQRKENDIDDSDEFDGVKYSEREFRDKYNDEDEYNYRLIKNIWQMMHKFYEEKQKDKYLLDAGSDHGGNSLDHLDYSILNFVQSILPPFLSTIYEAVSGLMTADVASILESDYIGDTVNDTLADIKRAGDAVADGNNLKTRSQITRYFSDEFGGNGDNLYEWLFSIHQFLDGLGIEINQAIANGNAQISALDDLASFLKNDVADIKIWDDVVMDAFCDIAKKYGANKSNIMSNLEKILRDFTFRYKKSEMDVDSNYSGIFAGIKSRSLLYAVKMYLNTLLL